MSVHGEQLDRESLRLLLAQAALQFHHLVPAEKRAGISARGLTMSLEALRAEAAKCVLLCSNCHAEVENGLATVG